MLMKANIPFHCKKMRSAVGVYLLMYMYLLTYLRLHTDLPNKAKKR